MSFSIEEIIKKMSLEEKSELCMGGTKWSTKPFPQYNIPEVFMSDGTNGIRFNKSKEEIAEEGKEELSFFDVTNLSQDSDRVNYIHPATCYPSGGTVASSWNLELAEEVGAALGDECRERGVSLLLAPGQNIRRHDLSGRSFEYFSEDPLLSGKFSAAYTKGVQSKGVGATIKHFVCNNSEYQRTKMSSHVDERALREIYLAGFEIAVKESDPWSVMSSYNRLNGVQMAENKALLTDILRGEWNFKGFVVSDWWGIKDRIESAIAGNDLEMPVNLKNLHVLADGVKSGDLDIEILDKMCRNILNFIKKAEDSGSTVKSGPMDRDKLHQVARKASEESVVMLKNNGLLPIDKGAVNSIAVIGNLAKYPRYQGGGCALVNPTILESPVEEISKKAGDNVKVEYARGYDGKDYTDDAMIAEAVKAASNADVVVVYAGLAINADVEGCDREELEIEQAHIRVIEAVAAANSKIVVVLNNGSVVSLEPWVDKVGAVLDAFFGGQAGASAVTNIIFGDVNPSGKLTVTFPEKIEDTPAYLHFPGENGVHYYSEGIFVGYRYFDYRKVEPAFPFGFGLSYTDFEYSDLSVPKGPADIKKDITVSLSVKNTGAMEGKEVVQLYIQPPESRLSRPVKELKGFSKISLKPGESGKVEFVLDKRAFAYYDPAFKDWVTEPGEYKVLIGSSSRDIRLSGAVDISGVEKRFPPIQHDTLHAEIFQNEKATKRYLDYLVEKDIVKRDEITDAFLEVLGGNFVGLKNCFSSMFFVELSDEEFDGLLDRLNAE